MRNASVGLSLQNNKRDTADIHYCTSLGAVFGIPKFAEALMKVINERNIHLHTR